MAHATFEQALKRLLAHEGGYSNHPSDPGGPTNFGITLADYRRYVKPNATAADVRSMRLDDAKAIYRGRYWDAMRCDELPAGLDYAVFDYAVNSGTGRAAKVLQRTLGFSDDGCLTDALFAAVRKRDTGALIAQLCDERLAFLRRLKTWPVFGAGWGRRVAEVRAISLAMAGREPAPAHDSGTASAKSAAKGVAPPNTREQYGTAGGIAATGAAAAQQAHQSGARIAIVIVIGAVALALAALGVWWWRRRRCIQQEG